MSIPTNMSSAPRDGSALLLTRYGKPSKFIGRWDGDRWVDAESGEFMSRVWHWEPAKGHERKWWACPLCRTPVLLHPADSPIGCHKDGCSNLSLPLIPRHEPVPVGDKSVEQVPCPSCSHLIYEGECCHRCAPPAARPTPTVKAPSRERCLQLADMEGDCTVGAMSPEMTARPTPITDAVARAACDDTGCLCRPEILWDSHADLERQLAEYQRCVDLCHDAIGESRESDITELHKYFEGYRNTINRVNELEDQLAEAREIITMHKDSKANLPEYSSRRKLHRQLASVTEQRDAMAAVLKEIRAGYDGRIATPECDCDDCVFLTRIDKALASVEGDHQ